MHGWRKNGITVSQIQLSNPSKQLDTWMIYYWHLTKTTSLIRNVLSTILRAQNVNWKPLTLEDAKDATFLETSFHIDDENNVRYWLKNENMNEIQKVWRYAHFNSYSDFSLKQRVLKATLQKVDGMASDKYALHGSAVDKLLEFKSLNYPPGMIARVCNYMAATSRNPTCFQT